MTRKQFNAREFERELVDAGYMPLNEYIRRWGENKDEVPSSRARIEAKHVLADYFLHHNDMWKRVVTNAARPKANTGGRADD